MRRMVVRSPISSCKKIRAQMRSTGLELSASTVSRRLSEEFDLHSRKPAREPRLSPVVKRTRMNFAKRHRDETIQDWNKDLFSDESTIQEFRKRHVRRTVGKRFNQRYTVATMEHSPSQMIWGAMSCSWTAGLYFLPPNTIMNGCRYVDLLQEKLEFHMNVHKCSIFMQGGAPCHRAMVTNFLREKNIAVLEVLKTCDELSRTFELKKSLPSTAKT